MQIIKDKRIQIMETIRVRVSQRDVYEEVAKATDYTGTKMVSGDDTTRDRILAGDADLETLGRFWDEAAVGANEALKEMLLSGRSERVKDDTEYVADIEVSKAFDKTLSGSVQKMLRSYFIASIIGQWFVFANKEESKEYVLQSASMLEGAERLLYSRRRPTRPQ